MHRIRAGTERCVPWAGFAGCVVQVGIGEDRSFTHEPLEPACEFSLVPFQILCLHLIDRYVDDELGPLG